MPSHGIVIHRLVAHGGPLARRWLDDCTELAFTFSREVHGERPESHASDVFAIELAATALWRTSRGKPCWSKLDADDLVDELGRLELEPALRSSILLSVYTFYCFLAKHGHLAREAAARAQDRLLPSVRPIFEQILAESAYGAA